MKTSHIHGRAAPLCVVHKIKLIVTSSLVQVFTHKVELVVTSFFFVMALKCFLLSLITPYWVILFHFNRDFATKKNIASASLCLRLSFRYPPRSVLRLF